MEREPQRPYSQILGVYITSQFSKTSSGSFNLRVYYSQLFPIHRPIPDPEQPILPAKEEGDLLLLVHFSCGVAYNLHNHL